MDRHEHTDWPAESHSHLPPEGTHTVTPSPHPLHSTLTNQLQVKRRPIIDKVRQRERIVDTSDIREIKVELGAGVLYNDHGLLLVYVRHRVALQEERGRG